LGIDLQFVLGQFSWDSRHILRLPCKYVSVILQESDERAFLFIVQVGDDDDSLAFISEPKVDPFHLLSWPRRGHGLSFVRRCNTPGVYIPIDNEYGFKHVMSVDKTDTKF
jgi:hypothetical protein